MTKFGNNYKKKDRWYYFIERIGKQRDGYSDNSKCFMLIGVIIIFSNNINKMKKIIIVFIIIVICLLNYSFVENFTYGTRDSSNNLDMEHGASQYYNFQQNETARQRPVDPSPPIVINPRETCPVASWYGDKVWGRIDGIGYVRSSPIKDDGKVDMEHELAKFMPNGVGEYDFKESNEYIYRRQQMTQQIESCKKPCFGVWEQIGVAENISTNKSSDLFGTSGGDVNYFDNKGSFINTGIKSNVITVSETALYSVDEQFNIIKCTNNSKPCMRGGTGSVKLNLNGPINKFASIIRIEVDQDDKNLWLLGKVDSSDHKLYYGQLSGVNVTFEPVSGIALTNLDGMSMSDKYVMVRRGVSYQLINRNTKQVFPVMNGFNNLQVVSDRYTG